MIKRLQKLLDTKPRSSEPDAAGRISTACAALMVEVMVIDRKIDQAEQTALKALVKDRFSLTDAETDELINDALSAVKDSTSLYQFTRAINDNFTDMEKFELVVKLWQIAFSDNHLDKHEEAIIRRIAELIHLPHSQFVRAKHKARPG